MANLNVEVSVKDIPEVLDMLTSLSTEVAGLKREVQALKGEDKRQIQPGYGGLYVDFAKEKPKQLTRAAVVKRAIADVAELERKMKSGVSNNEGNYTFRELMNVVKFNVNRNKRAVTALVYGKIGGELREKGIAKCTPDDVFNEAIGKAIALRRALGLTVPDDYLNAPKPEGKKAGDIIVLPSGERRKIVNPFPKDGECQPDSTNAKLGTIVDDSDRAEYKA